MGWGRGEMVGGGGGGQEEKSYAFLSPLQRLCSNPDRSVIYTGDGCRTNKRKAFFLVTHALLVTLWTKPSKISHRWTLSGPLD